jgi:hypothetical protein
MNLSIARVLKSSFSLLLLLFLVSTTVSAQKYIKVFEAGSNQSIIQENNKVIFENDTIKITYDLWSSYGNISFSVYNKLDVPIYVDWKKSAFIKQEKRHKYWSGKMVTEATSRLTPATKKTLAFTEGNTTQTQEERIAFIPPHSYIENPAKFSILEYGENYIFFKDIPLSFEYLSLKDQNKKELKGTEPGLVKVLPVNKSWGADGTIDIYQVEYSKENSPVSFSNFLTYSTTESFANEHYISNSFYIKRILEMDKKQFLGKEGKNDELETKKKKGQVTAEAIDPHSAYKTPASFFYYK